MQDQALNFEAATGVIEKQEDSSGATLVPEALAAGLSVVISILLLVLTVWIARFLSGLRLPQKPSRDYRVTFHTLSILVSSFLGLNVFFGGLTALLLNQNTDDSRSYFANISALKLSRLSHEHFFGYGVSFGILSLLALLFVGANKKRTLVPIFGMFFFGGLDVVSWWLTHYLSYGFHTLSFITGGVFSVCFLFLYVQITFTNFANVKEYYQGDR